MSDVTQAATYPIVITEIEQFGGAERSVLALARWMHERGLQCQVVTYIDHCGLAKYAAHPLEVIEFKAVGTRNRIAALGAWARARGPNAPQILMSGYQPALHGTLAGVRGFHDLMHDTPTLFCDPITHSIKERLRLSISNKIVGVGLRSGGTTIVTSEFLKAECRKDFGVEAQIARLGGL